MDAEELIGVNIKAYVTKDALEEIKRGPKYHGNLSTNISQSNRKIKIVWLDEK